jgi:hypothetical protein
MASCLSYRKTLNGGLFSSPYIYGVQVRVRPARHYRPCGASRVAVACNGVGRYLRDPVRGVCRSMRSIRRVLWALGAVKAPQNSRHHARQTALGPLGAYPP